MIGAGMSAPGMIVALTQSVGRLAGLQGKLEKLGVRVLRVPLIRTEPIQGANLEGLRVCRWWLFTSVSAVEAMVELNGFGTTQARDSRLYGAVGASTAHALLELAGITARLVSPIETARGLAQALIERYEPGPFGWPCGERALPDLRQELEASGRELIAVPVYRGLELDFPRDLPQPDAIVVASPSAVNALPVDVARAATLVALGSSTAGAATACGYRVVTANAPSEAAVLAALESVRALALTP